MAVDIDSPIRRARLAVAFSLERLRTQVSEAKAQQFPGDHPGPLQWLELISGLLDTAAEYLKRSAEPGQSAKKEAELVRDAAHLAFEAYNYLVLMRGAGMDELPYAIIPPLQRWFEQLGVSNSTFFRAELLANYELASIPDRLFSVRDPSASLTKTVQQIDWPFLRVTVPGKAFAIVPHLAIVAHEIGHALFSKINWDLSPFVATEADDLFKRICTRLMLPHLDAGTVKFLQDAFRSWWEELSADAFAFYLTGPAIFFSLPEFSQFLSDGYGLSDTHPATDLRRSVLFAKLSDGGSNSFATIFKKHTAKDLTEDFNSPLVLRPPDSDQLYVDLCTKQDQNIAAVLTELHASMPVLVGLVYDHVEQYLRTNATESIYSAQKYDADLSEHLGPMLVAVPPIEAGPSLDSKVPTEFASILNVGWAVLLTKLGDLQVRAKEPDLFGANRLEVLQGLLSKAVELSEARRVWER